MIVNRTNLNAMFDGFNTHFNKGLGAAETHYQEIAMVIPSTGRDENYGWLGQIPGMREWIGPRHVKNLMLHDWKIKNRSFEDTIGVPREDVEDDKYGLFTPFFAEMGRAASAHPNKLIFELLAAGFTSKCYDGQFFFSADHPVSDGESAPANVSNMQAGDGTPWFLFDTRKPLKALIYQQRKPPHFVSKDKETDDNVFMNKEYVYGVDSRGNAGYGLWQLAFASKADLTAENYEAARIAMASLKGDSGSPLGIAADTLVAPSSLEGAAMRLLNNGTRVEIIEDIPVSVQNEWAGTAKPIITPFL